MASDRLTATVNPGRGRNSSNVELVHVRAVGPNDTLHYVWCFHSTPTVLLALTSHASNLSVMWENFPRTAHSISFNPKPIYSFGMSVNKLYEFNDLNDTGLLDMSNYNETYIHSIEMPDSWEMKNIQQNLESVLLVMEGSWKNDKSFVKRGILRIELETFRDQGHDSILPRLMHSANATQLELSMRNMATNSNFQRGRFAAEIILAANESSESSVFPTAYRSLDDERTPGVFSLIELQTTASKTENKGGYVQWRPVAYVADERDIVNSTETAFYEIKNISNSSSQLNGTLMSAYFGTDLNINLLNAVNVSFGAKGDGFYAQNNISIWTVTIGYGHPPNEFFSLFVILIMSFCLGLPALIILISGLYLCFRRISYRKDDLFLSE
ncbi:Glycosylated lysosomal membrane protein B [Frankliniella fusca]|uniref:Glycosylated lysosomal membrane protein B n=1 Tax=Frankliniella fusca TaxID=407009 RepID=A0AAE1LT35_9NEOP|nr:Glycosylated lysosomal membrane protein B [Frankliniella fusca]